jgi:hypothetical protein
MEHDPHEDFLRGLNEEGFRDEIDDVVGVEGHLVYAHSLSGVTGVLLECEL